MLAVSLLSACRYVDKPRVPLLPEPVRDLAGNGSASSPPSISPASRVERGTTEPSSNIDDSSPADVVKRIAEVNSSLADAFFDYAQADLRPDAVSVLQRDAESLHTILSEFPGLKVAIEGHCDERGSAEYNLALGDRRATRALAALYDFGLPRLNAETVSYGKEAPQCAESSESCWQRNRRVHLSVHE